MKRHIAIMMMIMGLLPAAAQQQQSGLPVELAKQSDARRDEAKQSTAIYVELFEKGANAEGFSGLGYQMLKLSKPIQAQALFGKALKLEPNHKKAREGVELARKNVAKKSDLLKRYQEREIKSKKPQDVCSQAAILFHMGYMGDAVEMLDSAKANYGDNEEIIGLWRTFSMGIGVERMVVKQVLHEFQQAITAKKKLPALQALAEFEFFALGTGDTTRMVKKLADTFKSEIDPVRISKILSSPE